MMKKPKWLNTRDYPFKSNFFETPIGNMHYIDEGKGDPIIFVHGNPSWSFGFRNLIKEFSKTHRCIAPDHLGFGLSDKPTDWTYLPKEHAKNFDLFLESLDLENITLVVEDWGGPIGLSYAIAHPDRIKNIVITNTWLWSVKYDWYYQLFSKFMGGSLGRWLIRKHNFFAKYVMKSVFGDKSKLTPEIHKHFLMPFDNQKERKGCWVFPKQVIDSSYWLDSLWNRHDILKNKNVLIAWGMKDIAFRKKELNRWIKSFPKARIVRFEDAGHFVSEEKDTELIKEIKAFF